MMDMCVTCGEHSAFLQGSVCPQKQKSVTSLALESWRQVEGGGGGGKGAVEGKRGLLATIAHFLLTFAGWCMYTRRPTANFRRSVVGKGSGAGGSVWG